MLKGYLIAPATFIVMAIVVFSLATYINQANKIKMEYFIQNGKMVRASKEVFFERSEILAFAKTATYLCSEANAYNRTIGNSTKIDTCVSHLLNESFGNFTWNNRVYGKSKIYLNITIKPIIINETNINVASDNLTTQAELNRKYLNYTW